jgi:hypothetical protein
MRVRYKTSLFDKDVEDAFNNSGASMEIVEGITNFQVLEMIVVEDIKHIQNKRPLQPIDSPIIVHIENIGLFVVKLSVSIMNRDLIGERAIKIDEQPVESAKLLLQKEG